MAPAAGVAKLPAAGLWFYANEPTVIEVFRLSPSKNSIIAKLLEFLNNRVGWVDISLGTCTCFSARTDKIRDHTLRTGW